MRVLFSEDVSMSRKARIAQIAAWIARSVITAWVGAAILFVMVGVREVTAPDFSSEVKDRLVVIRFPLFYATGLTLVGIGLFLNAFMQRPLSVSALRGRAISGLLMLALIGMVCDYVGIYQPLEAMVIPPGQPRTPEFTRLHQWSTRINMVNLTCCLIAAGLMNWHSAASQRDDTESR